MRRNSWTPCYYSLVAQEPHRFGGSLRLWQLAKKNEHVKRDENKNASQHDQISETSKPCLSLSSVNQMQDKAAID